MTTLLKFFVVVFFLTSKAYAVEFIVNSPDIKAGGRIAEAQVFNGFGCQGTNLSPALKWAGVPPGTKSFAVTLYDFDAPTGSGWWHWVVFNIPADSTGLAAAAGQFPQHQLPAGSIQSRTDFGTPGYGGPCPPPKAKPHKYALTVYALNTDKLSLDENAPAAMVGYFLHQHLIKKAVLTAYYGR